MGVIWFFASGKTYSEIPSRTKIDIIHIELVLLSFINDPNSARSSSSDAHEQTSNTNVSFVETILEELEAQAEE